MSATHAIEAERCRRSAHVFLFDSGHVKTRDEHDAQQPIKPIPDLPYLRALVDAFLVSGRLLAPEDAAHALAAGLPATFLHHLHATGILFIEKSRDMFVTNIVTAYLFWRGRAFDHQLILVQSKKADDANPLVFKKDPQFSRIAGMEDRLPAHLRTMTWPQAHAEGHLYAPNGTHWRAIPEGGHIIRSEHPSVIFSDEAAFQTEFGASFTAAMPAVEGGGQYLAVSSAEPGDFEGLVEATGEGIVTQPTRIPGLGWRIASGTIPVLRVHYAADPARRPGTVEGEAWRARALTRYPGGERSPRWRKEMEIEYRAFGGLKVFPEWERWSAGPPFVIPRVVPTGWRLYGSYDHGWTNPAAFHVHAVTGEGRKVTLWEFYADRVPVSAIARLIKGEAIRTPPRTDATIDRGRTEWPGCPYAGQLTWMIADPSLWAQDQPMNDAPNKAIADLFRQEGVVFLKGERGADATVAEWLTGTLWRDPAQPQYQIVQDCKWLIWELTHLRYREQPAHVMMTANASEEFVDKDNHAWDGLKMFLKRFPPPAAALKPAAAPASFDWWRAQTKAAATGQAVKTFRIQRELAR